MPSASNMNWDFKREDEAELVRLAAGGDFEAFGKLVTATEARVFSHLLRMTQNSADAQELLQETYLSAFKNLRSFKGNSSFYTWVYRIATNHALMHYRRQKPETSVEELPLPTHEELKNRRISDWDLNPEEAAKSAEIKAMLGEAIARLPEGYRAVVVLRDIEGLSTAETAEILGINEGAVKTKLHRARIFLREILSRSFGPQEFSNPQGS
ncbi:sigma-70 family RNA polymerase sigma factor [bacterium]|nr:MAG: sigma-70 family RNA polymerase sigma factor [bacterium]